MDKRKLGGSARSHTTKGEISKEFKKLEKYGYKVFNFNSNLKMRCKDWVDLVVAGHHWLFLLEVKMGKDSLKKGQEETQNILSHIQGNCKYEIVTENNYTEIIDNILSGNYEHR